MNGSKTCWDTWYLPVMGEFLTLTVPLLGEGLALNFDSSLLGREMGLGILNLPEVGLRLMVFEIEQLEQLECVWE